jgi:hypothetical protein
MGLLRYLENEGHSLAVCKIRLNPQQSGQERSTAVIFELSVGSESFGSLAIPAAEIGVPLNLSEAMERQRSDDGYRVPDSLIDFARAALPSGEPLYLVFEPPSGYLPGVPWEKLATARLERPVLRLGAVPVRPVRSDRTLDIAYCCSLQGTSEAQWQVVKRFIQGLPTDLPRRARLHVFVDAGLFPRVHAEAAALDFGETVRVYDPSEAARYVGQRASSSDPPEASELANPWLLWIRDSLKQLSVDGVHFLTMGHLGRTRPALSFSSPPVNDDEYAWSPVVGARQLAVFLEQIGAWAVGFSSPPENTSVLGLRMLFDEITRMVTGPVALHDMSSDADGEALRQLYWYMFAPEQAALPCFPTLTLATHPDWTLAINRQANLRLDQLIDEYSLRSRVPELTEAIDTPAWVAAQQRSLEKTIATIVSAPETAADKNRERGVLDALKFTSDLVAKYAKLGGGTRGGGGGENLL